MLTALDNQPADQARSAADSLQASCKLVCEGIRQTRLARYSSTSRLTALAPAVGKNKYSMMHILHNTTLLLSEIKIVWQQHWLPQEHSAMCKLACSAACPVRLQHSLSCCSPHKASSPRTAGQARGTQHALIAVGHQPPLHNTRASCSFAHVTAYAFLLFFLPPTCWKPSFAAGAAAAAAAETGRGAALPLEAGALHRLEAARTENNFESLAVTC